MKAFRSTHHAVFNKFPDQIISSNSNFSKIRIASNFSVYENHPKISQQGLWKRCADHRNKWKIKLKETRVSKLKN